METSVITTRRASGRPIIIRLVDVTDLRPITGPNGEPTRLTIVTLDDVFDLVVREPWTTFAAALGVGVPGPVERPGRADLAA